MGLKGTLDVPPTVADSLTTSTSTDALLLPLLALNELPRCSGVCEFLANVGSDSRGLPGLVEGDDGSPDPVSPSVGADPMNSGTLMPRASANRLTDIGDSGRLIADLEDDSHGLDTTKVDEVDAVEEGREMPWVVVAG
jgi:hypothetical protein